MSTFYKSLIKPILFNLDTERAHDIAIGCASFVNRSTALQHLLRWIYEFNVSTLEKKFWGLTFPNPVGLAAGFDKNGIAIHAMQALGFGFVEVGSITAQPSTGNPKPRAFRLPEDQSLINRMGLNNEGAQTIIKRLKSTSCSIPVGINIAKTNNPAITGRKALDDYAESYSLALSTADYITINISCPNTGEGKTFEDPEALSALLGHLDPAAHSTPTLVKFSVDTNQETLAKLVEICESHEIDGYVATNTSSLRQGLKTPAKKIRQIGSGGLSGKAISTKSTAVIAGLYEILRGSKPIIGVGGIHDIDSAKAKIDAGADLLQLYTALVFEGPGLPKKLKKALAKQQKANV